jgi:O-methyltransferase
MFLQIKRFVRRIFWRILGAPPQAQARSIVGINTKQPRYEMLDNAIKIIQHNTRVSRRKCRVGEEGSLLGDYLEFGCFEGNTFLHAYKRAAPLMPWMRFWAIDSFQGLPEPSGQDKDGEFWQGQFSCDQDTFLKNLRDASVDFNRIICVPGWFHETLTPELKRQKNLKIASIVYVDCDLYNSAVPVLNYITDLVETGSVIIFDDWFCFKGNPERGVQRACSEWLSENPGISLNDWHLFGAYGKSFIVYRKPL